MCSLYHFGLETEHFRGQIVEIRFVIKFHVCPAGLSAIRFTVLLFCGLSAQPNISSVLCVSQTSERHSHSLENEVQLIVTTLRITNEQKGEKGKLDQTIEWLPHAQRLKGHISSFCLKLESIAHRTLYTCLWNPRVPWNPLGIAALQHGKFFNRSVSLPNVTPVPILRRYYI